MKLDIITPETILFSADATHVMVPGSMGDFGVLEGHAPFISTLRDGVIIVDEADGTARRFAVSGGLAEANPEACIVLAEAAIECSDWSDSDITAKRSKADADIEAAKTPAQRVLADKMRALIDAAEAAR